jgi:signal transduction histidine kinase
VLGDAHHLTRLFTNLVDNAVRHTPADGRVTLAATERGGSVVVRVEDTGEGIPPEHLPHICERFYRVEAARSHSAPREGAGSGTGLGLSICESIAAAHGGKLSIESRPGEGTTVTVSLRAAGDREV